MIRLEDLTREYRIGNEALRALDGITETVEEGEHVAIMGPSGSGKSTLLNILGCLDRPTSGRYELDGREVSRLGVGELSEIRRHKVGFIFQAYHLIARLDAAGNVELPMTFAGVSPSERRKRARETLAAVGLADRAHHRPDQLSGGERQRVAIARAISMRPRILLADEPTGNLDTTSGRQVLEILQGMNREGLTLLVVTHDPAVARRADRIVVLRDGKIVRRMASGELPANEDPPAEAGGAP